MSFSPETEQQLLEAAKRPYTLFEFGHVDKSEYATPNFVNFRLLAQRAAVVATADLALGNSDRASDVLHVNLALSRGLHGEESLFVGTMIGVAIENISLGVVWRGLVDHAWEEGQLVELDRELRRRDLIASIQDAMRRERALSGDHFSDTAVVVVSFYNLSRIIGSRAPKMDSKDVTAVRSCQTGWAHRARAAYANLIQDSVVAFYDRNAQVAKPSVVSKSIVEIKRMNTSKASPRSLRANEHSELHQGLCGGIEGSGQDRSDSNCAGH